MLMYIGLVVFYFLCMLLEKIIKKSLNKSIWFFVLVLPLFILAAFRAPSVGNDTFNYFKSYLTVTSEPFFSVSQSRMEIGYVFYMRLIALLGFSYLGFQVITSAFTLFSISRFISKYSTNIAFSFYIFMTTRMFFGTMNTSRQYLAIAILLFSVEFIKNRKFIKFLSLILIATSIHFTAIVFLIAYPLPALKLNAKKTSLFIITGIVMSIFFDALVQVFVNITGRYKGYLEGGYFNFEENIAIYLNLLINALFFLVAFLTKYWKANVLLENSCKNLKLNEIDQKIERKKITNEQLWYTFCLLTLIVSISGLNATIMSRIEVFFSVFFLAFIPSVIKSIRSKVLRVIVTFGIIIGLFASFIVVMIYRPYWTTVFPYQWYWSWQN